MNSRAKFRFRFENVFRKYEQDSRVAELALARCLARVDGIKSKIIESQNINQIMAETWNQSVQKSCVSSIESRLVISRENQALIELQTELHDALAEVKKVRAELVAILRRLRSIEMIREKDLAAFERELKKKSERDTLEMVLRKKFSAK